MGFLKNVIYRGYPLKDLNIPFKIPSKLNIQFIYCLYTPSTIIKTCYNSERVFQERWQRCEHYKKQMVHGHNEHHPCFLIIYCPCT